MTREYAYSVAGAHLSGDVWRVSYAVFIQLVRHSYEKRQPPKLRIGGLIIRVCSVKALEQIDGVGWIVEIEEWKQNGK